LRVYNKLSDDVINFVFKKNYYFIYIMPVSDNFQIRDNILDNYTDINNLSIKKLKYIAKQLDISDYDNKDKDDLKNFIIREIDSKKIRESNSAIKGFTKQYTINGSEGIDPQLFFKNVQPQVTDLLVKK